MGKGQRKTGTVKVCAEETFIILFTKADDVDIFCDILAQPVVFATVVDDGEEEMEVGTVPLEPWLLFTVNVDTSGTRKPISVTRDANLEGLIVVERRIYCDRNF